MQSYSVAGGDGIQNSKTPVRLEKTAAESSKKIKSYLQSDFQKKFRNNCITSALKMLSKYNQISVHVVYQPLQDNNKTAKCHRK